VHPELFVLKYFENQYSEELAADPIFESRRKGESKKEYLERAAEANKKRSVIVNRYYQQYLSSRKH